MHLIVWEYHVKSEHIAEFEKIYDEKGAWVELFQKGNGYLGTELLHDSTAPDHYVTIDRWASAIDYESFLSQWEKEYKKLDAQCVGLTVREVLLGKWESISRETR